jgi:hypothetical protein
MSGHSKLLAFASCLTPATVEKRKTTSVFLPTVEKMLTVAMRLISVTGSRHDGTDRTLIMTRFKASVGRPIGIYGFKHWFWLGNATVSAAGSPAHCLWTTSKRRRSGRAEAHHDLEERRTTGAGV